MSNGRSVQEFLQLLQALQTSDQHKVATPEGWHPGDKVIVPTPSSVAALEARLEEDGVDFDDWYFCTKTLMEQQSPSSSLRIVLTNGFTAS